MAVNMINSPEITHKNCSRLKEIMKIGMKMHFRNKEVKLIRSHAKIDVKSFRANTSFFTPYVCL